jgi:hypothetical protein
MKYLVYRRVLSDIAVWIYQGITKTIEEEVQPFLVIALLEHEGIGGLSGRSLFHSFLPISNIPPKDLSNEKDQGSA